MNPDVIVKLIEQRAWVPLAAFAIGLVVRLLKNDTVLPTIPGKYRVWAALGLGVVSGILERFMTGGVTWTSAIIGGFVSAAFAIIGHDTLIGALREGRELPLPGGLIIPGASPEAGKPVTIPPENGIPKLNEPDPPDA